MKKRAFVTGITGQLGRYLAERLMSFGYEVHGLVRYSSKPNSFDNLKDFSDLFDKQIFFHYGDMLDSSRLEDIITEVEPLLVFNLAAQSHVGHSFKMPIVTSNVNALGTLRLLEACRLLDNPPRFVQASTSELYGNTTDLRRKVDNKFQISKEAYLTEESQMCPDSPYAVSKLFAYHMVKNYRKAYKMHASNAIMFNFESPHRGEEFVTRKITKAVTNIAYLRQEKLVLGNLQTSRDWSYAGDTAKALTDIAFSDHPDDYNICSGVNTKLQDFVEKCFKYHNISIKWIGKDLDTVGVEEDTGRILVETDEKFYRPVDVTYLLGDNSKIITKLGWTPEYDIDALVGLMMAEEETNLLDKIELEEIQKR